jgi:hypothetical protein
MIADLLADLPVAQDQQAVRRCRYRRQARAPGVANVVGECAECTVDLDATRRRPPDLDELDLGEQAGAVAL